MHYKVFDNSWCMNIKTKRHAYLVQDHTDYYSPDKDEDDALFEVISMPYSLHIVVQGYDYGRRFFINIVSSLTGNIYRTVYSKYAIY